MQVRSLISIAAAAMLGVGACASTDTTSTGTGTTKDQPSPSTVSQLPAAHVQLDLVDESRPAVDPATERSAPTRALPTELYLPAASGPRPLIVFAHGYDGDPSKFTQLFQVWSDAGFVVAAPRFPVTYTGAGSSNIARAGDIGEQPADMAFVLDQVLASKYRSRIDRKHIGAAGLSLGGGTIWGWVADSCCRDDRITAAIVMDGNQFGFASDDGEINRVPLLVYHADQDPALSFAGARAAYERAATPKYFVTLFGAMHAQPFEDSPSPADDVVEQSSVLFWRAYLLDDTKARAEIVTAASVSGVSSADVTE